MCVLGAAAGFAPSALAETRRKVSQSRPTELLREASSWAYQLQSLDIGVLARASHDILVIDFPSGDGDGRIGRREISRLKRRSGGRPRLVLAYMNIGEAEDYRFYWQKTWAATPPAWMGMANCRWKGDHRARHWSTEWQSILFGSRSSYLGRIIDAGFDGVWLDRVDIHRHWSNERISSFADMVTLVTALSAWSKHEKPGFLVVPQNGEELLADAAYRSAIDGLGKEDLLFGDHGNDVPNEPWRIEKALSFIQPAHADGMPVLSVEYVKEHANQRIALERHRALGFVACLAPRSLAYLGPNAGRHPEDGDSEPLADEQAAEAC